MSSRDTRDVVVGRITDLGPRGRGDEVERRSLRRLGAGFRLVRSSGQGARKGDIEGPGRGDFLIEVKSTRRESLSLPLRWLRKLTRQAREQRRRPALLVVFDDGQGTPRREGAWVLVRESDWRELTDADGG